MSAGLQFVFSSSSSSVDVEFFTAAAADITAILVATAA